ncbi:hypothetical protein VNO78_24060 [Psophocarpus tetragonolobus]|uniref:Uncharacterized protein n=1 Tax=Psophocarpus tetragonolobus TaxID=3891 RepID=A0AAN9S434_PSOTE
MMPDSFEDLTSKCLPELSWQNYFKKKIIPVAVIVSLEGSQNKDVEMLGHGHGHHDLHIDRDGKSIDAEQLLRYRVVAQVLELRIVKRRKADRSHRHRKKTAVASPQSAFQGEPIRSFHTKKHTGHQLGSQRSVLSWVSEWLGRARRKKRRTKLKPS